MGVAAVTGSASGIGAAIARRLAAAHTVVGIDVRDADVVADLAEPRGREAAISAVRERAGGRLDRLVVCAGVGPQITPPSRIISVNYFGAVELLDGLLDGLRAGSAPAAVALCSNSAQMFPLDDAPLVQAMLAGDEPEARRLADEGGDGTVAYAASKHALGRAVRRRASAWGAARVRLNAVAPGPVETPLLRGGLDDPKLGPLIRAVSVPIGRWGSPDDVAGLVVFLLGPEASWIHGAVYYIDGGNDAELRPDRF